MDISLHIVVALYLFVAGFGWALSWINLKHLEEKGATVPKPFEGHVNSSVLRRIRDYTVERTRFGLIESVFESSLAILFILVILKPFDEWVSSLGFSFIASGEVFFFLLIYAQAALSMPFSLWRTFVIEKKYGFLKMTPGLWAMDAAKSLMISSVIGGALIFASLWIVEASPGLWWFWLWGLFLAFSLFMMYLSPYVIEPLFNKFEEVDDEDLKARINDVLSKAGIRVARVLKVDASRRTAHTNAYFTGIGHVKRIVLYDTLMRKLEGDELVSVLAHETGHWKRRHLLKGIALVEALGLIVLYLSFRALEGGSIERLFNIPEPSFFAKAVLLGFLAPVAAFPFTPAFSWFSRRHEREADSYAVELTGSAKAMTGALVKLSKDNLSNLHPHPLYAAFYYSHPPVVERIDRIIRGRETWKN